jgi:DNA helicase II / ATP-dependent DNA helicase PcrA
MTLPAPVQERLERLAPDQRAAATADAGPVLCVAPAGSGKTTTLVARIAWRIAIGTDPARICALTFNKRAADELASRLEDALTPLAVEPGTVRVRTFHALGREILADAGVDVRRLVDRAELLTRIHGRPVPPVLLRRMDDAFSRLTLDPDSAMAGGTELDPWVAKAYERYRQALHRENALDFDDLVAGSLDRLRQDAQLRDRWRARCSTLMVDEAQDLDRSQLELALLLCEPARDVFLVGDDDQTIYAWRLADVRRILGLAASLPGLRRVDLEVNYRCPAEVVSRAVRLIEHGQERFVKVIRAGPSARGTLVLAADPGDPVARARRLLGAWYGQEEGGYAVLARTNAELAPVAAAALERGIPYQAAQDGLLLEDPALPAVADALRNRMGPDADLPALDDLLRGLEGVSVVLRQSLLAWAAGPCRVDGLADVIGDAIGRNAELHHDGARLILATMHTTKGLEFDHVAVLGMDDGGFPSERTLSESADRQRALEEERRLAYVAWTRARRSLLLLYDPAAPSAFLQEAFDPGELAA